MRIAVPFDNGQIFPHFGKSECFKIYDTTSVFVLKSELVETAETAHAHSSLAAFLTEKDVQVVICGGIGEGAIAALAEAGIQALTGAQGEADEIEKACLKNEIKLNTQSTCGHSCSGEEHPH